MLRALAKLTIIIAVGIGLYFGVSSVYPTGTANIIALGYFLLTLRLYDLLESIEERFAGSPNV